MRRPAVFTAAVFAAAMMALTGCTGAQGSSGNATAPPKEPKLALAEAAQKTSTTSFKFTLADPKSGDATGAYDPATKGLTLTGKDDDGKPLEVIMLDSDIYLKSGADLGKCTGKWLHFDIKKFLEEAGADMSIVDSPADLLLFLGGAATVERTGDGTYKGTIDATKLPTGASEALRKAAEQLGQQAGDKAKNIPFEASVNAAGYLTRLKLTTPGTDNGKDETFNLSLSDFGSTVTIAKPPADQVVEFANIASCAVT